MQKSSLSDADKQILQKQSFTLDCPGTLLKDFEVLLGYIGEGIQVSAASCLLSLKDLPVINEQLSYSLQLQLKRPQQKSYPHINGLFLLLRASGLTKLQHTPKKTLLILDDQILASWKSLNFQERYFSLMEAWLYRGNPEILGERGASWDFGYFFRSIEYFLERLNDGVNVKATPYLYDSLKYHPGLHNLALMQMSGWLTIELDDSIAQNWPIATITPTTWGRSLSRYYRDQLQHYLQDEDDDITLLNHELAQYIPELKHTLAQPQDESLNNKTIILKVALHDAWRRLQVSDATLFDELADGILKAFNFDNDHLYEFAYKNRYGYSEHIVHPMMEGDGPISSEWALGAIPLYRGMTLTFTFDFGDNWEFLLTVESIVDQLCKSKPKLLEKHGKPPKQYADDW